VNDLRRHNRPPDSRIDGNVTVGLLKGPIIHGTGDVILCVSPLSVKERTGPSLLPDSELLSSFPHHDLAFHHERDRYVKIRTTRQMK
jgi:hypothetical protein